MNRRDTHGFWSRVRKLDPLAFGFPRPLQLPPAQPTDIQFRECSEPRILLKNQFIAEHITATHGIRIAPPSVYLFFKRSVRRKTLPLGFEDLAIECEDSDGPSKPKLARPAAGEESQQQTPESAESSLMPINQRKRGNWFDYNPEQGIHYVPKN